VLGVSEVHPAVFSKYIRQWRKKVVFVVNKVRFRRCFGMFGWLMSETWCLEAHRGSGACSEHSAVSAGHHVLLSCWLAVCRLTA
jgi:hypothetical protein